MTPTDSTQIAQKFALEGPLSVEKLIVIGVVLVLLVGIFAQRDYKAAGSRSLLAFLFLPRAVAVGIILWMLAGPTLMTMSRQFKPKSIVVMVDGSASMGLADGLDGSGNTLQWSAMKDVPALATLDQVIGTLISAQSAVGRLRETPTPEGWAQIKDWLGTATGDLSRVNLEASRIDAETRGELARASSFLTEGLARISESPLSSGATRQTQVDRADEWSSFIGGGLRRVERIAQKAAIQFEQNPPGGGKAALASESQESREDKVVGWLGRAEDSWLKDLARTARILRYKFASNILPVPDDDWRNALLVQTNLNLRGTDLGAALNQAARDAGQQSLAAAILVTDGGHNAPADPRAAAAALRGVPLFIVPIGSTIVPRDVILHHIQCPKAVFQKDMVIVDAMVTAYYCQGEQVRVELLADGAVVETQTLPVTADVFDGRVSFHWKGSELGRHILKVRAVPVPRELTLDNNEAQTEVQVMEDTIRVLLADDLPRWEFRYLSMLFKRDKHIDFDQLIFEPNDDSQAGQSSFPQDLEGWRKYRVVILGDVTPAQLSVSQQEMLRKYVSEEGGNLVVIAGETGMPDAFSGQPLGEIIPALSARLDPNEGYNLAVTAEGSVSVPTQLEDDPLASERIWRDISARLPVYSLSPTSRPKPTAHVLISAIAPDQSSDQRAFLSWQYVGLGRVIYIAAPVTYELRYGVGDLYHHRFWGQLLRWAIARDMAGGSKTVHLLTDKNRYEVGDHAQVVLRLTSADGIPVGGARCGIKALRGTKIIKDIEMHEEPNAPGTYRGMLADLTPGPITLQATGQSVQSLLVSEGHDSDVEQTITVDMKATTELTDPVCNLPLLHQLADASGGTLLPPGALPNALAHLNIAPESQDTVLSRQPMWNRWLFLWIFMGCMTMEWLARRYWRML